jgi:transcriptional regulator with XRE-family HTH domain
MSEEECMAVPRNGSTKEFAKQLCERLEELHWDRRSLAVQMKVNVATVRNWQHGKSFPTLRSRARLCELLGMSAKQLRLPPFNEED